MSLWHGDGKYDFTRWENIGEGSKKNDLKNADRDELPEENLPGKQLTEVRSEFDYFGTYTDISGRNGINIGIIKHEYEISFIRPPGHCINQFREGTTVYNANALQANIAVNAPQGVYPGTDKDMNRMIGIWSLRHDATLWRPGQYYYRAKNGNWNRQTANVASNLDGAPTDSDGTTVMIAASVDMDKGRALCLYRPKTVKNTDVIIGRDSDKRTGYRDSRRNKIKVIYDLGRSTVISKYGFSSRLKGMINRTQFNQGIYAGRGVYEVYRNDIYILYGTPNEIIDAIALLDTSLGL
jgi:hypothetical protein